jgi:hypothetical protein
MNKTSSENMPLEGKYNRLGDQSGTQAVSCGPLSRGGSSRSLRVYTHRSSVNYRERFPPHYNCLFPLSTRTLAFLFMIHWLGAILALAVVLTTNSMNSAFATQAADGVHCTWPSRW